MLNAEKYRDEILRKAEEKRKDVKEDDRPLSHAIDDICRSYLGIENTIEWLLSEYEPPLLKNGDGLKPGDCIMVETENGWEKHIFLCFKFGFFYTVNSELALMHGSTFSRLEIARLPEDGE